MRAGACRPSSCPVVNSCAASHMLKAVCKPSFHCCLLHLGMAPKLTIPVPKAAKAKMPPGLAVVAKATAGGAAPAPVGGKAAPVTLSTVPTLKMPPAPKAPPSIVQEPHVVFHCTC